MYMDYKNILEINLLSDNNINFLTNYFYSKFKITKSAMEKCRNIIINNFKLYLKNIQKYPENNDQVIEAIEYLNNTCLNDFEKYLIKKYGSNDIYRYIPNQEIIIISETEKNNLINKENTMQVDLTDPLLLEMLTLYANQNINHKKKIYCQFDSIIDENELQRLLSKNNNKSNMNVSPCLSRKKYDIKKSIDEFKKEIDINNLDNESLLKIELWIKELLNKRKDYTNDLDSIALIDEEKKRVIEAIANHKKKITEIINKKTIMEDVKKLDNNEILNLEFDPSHDYNDLRDITINITEDRKIKMISLIKYYVPLNENTINRFNNQFIIYYENKVNKIIIPPGKYDIESLIEFIKNEASYLDIILDQNTKLITFTAKTNFELLTEGDTIFTQLGFTQKANTYKDENTYTANEPYNLEANKNIMFNLMGSTCDPVKLIANIDYTPNEPIILRKMTRALNIKKIKLNLTNSLNQCYDFDSVFRLCIQIEYV